ncbi:MAG: ABC transporter permease [Gemmatimonadetes bacterium]|nr:MAG: ABC transporter permease [Gemmatimonadota bacterium]
MNSVLVVMRREYLQRVRNRWFILGTIALPVFMIAVFAIPIFLEARGERAERRIAVVDETGRLAAAVVERLEGSFDVDAVPYTDGVYEALQSRVDEGEIAGFLVLDEGTLREGRATYQGDGRPGTVRRLRLQQAVTEAVVAHRLAESGADVDVAALLAGGDIDWVNLSEEEPEGAERAVGLVTGFVGSFFLYMILLLYGVQVMRSVLEEKTTRIVEVIISAVRPWQLMLGKIVGVGAVGLTQVGIWALMAVLVASFGLPAVIAARPEMAQLENVAEYLPGLAALGAFLVFFVLGFFLYSALYAAVAAMCSTEEEAQQTQVPVTMLLVVPIIVLSMVMESPHSTFAVVMSLVPFFSPVLMFPRMLAGAPLWQVGLSFVLMAGTVVAVAWVAGRIYRVGILMQGKRPTLPELVRWVREA